MLLRYNNLLLFIRSYSSDSWAEDCHPTAPCSIATSAKSKLLNLNIISVNNIGPLWLILFYCLKTAHLSMVCLHFFGGVICRPLKFTVVIRYISVWQAPKCWLADHPRAGRNTQRLNKQELVKMCNRWQSQKSKLCNPESGWFL